MSDIDLKNATLVLQRRNQYEGEGEDKKIVGIECYTVNLKGENGLVAFGRLTPEHLDEALASVIEDRVRARLDGLREDIEGALKDAQSSVSDARTTYNERMRTAFSKLGLGRMTPEKKKEAPIEA